MDTLGQKTGGLCKNERGFTLGEVLITIVIMGIVFAIASSTWQSVVQGRAVDSATNQLASDMRLAHTSATNQLASWRIVLVPDREAPSEGFDYYLVKLTAAGAVDTSATVNRYLPDNTSIVPGDLLLNDSGLGTLYASLGLGSDPSRSLEFDPDGSMDNFSPALAANRDRVSVTDDGNPERSITFNEETSRISVVN